EEGNGLNPVEILRRHANEDPDFPKVLRALDLSPLLEAARHGNWDAYEILAFMKDFNAQAAAEVEKIAHETGVPRAHLDAREHLLMRGDPRALSQLEIFGITFDSLYARDLLSRFRSASPRVAPPIEDPSLSTSDRFSTAFQNLVHTPGFEEMIRDNFP